MSQTTLFADPLINAWPASREAALVRLDAFIGKVSKYAEQRNYDYGPERRDNISGLSPYITSRLITEEEVARKVLGKYALSTVEKFVQEVCWRTYWKGWLEMRPDVWADYRALAQNAKERLEESGTLRKNYEEAILGRTGIDCFDAWSRELTETGYLHNHTRMWYASIWIFTLNLPWELGADFFWQHLLDGDAASNTLSWRWVAGLQTKGKNYIARASNIAKFTGGRFQPANDVLASSPSPKDEDVEYERQPLELPDNIFPDNVRIGWLMSPEDLAPWDGRDAFDGSNLVAVSGGLAEPYISQQGYSEKVVRFRSEAFTDARKTVSDQWQLPFTKFASEDWQASLHEWIGANDIQVIAMPKVATGAWKDFLADVDFPVPTMEVLRRWDKDFWPHATHGFFRFKSAIPKKLS